jgi:hypothetical protein
MSLGRPLISRLWWVATLAVMLAACDPLAIVANRHAISDQLELRVQDAPVGASEPAAAFGRDILDAQEVDDEFGVDLTGVPDVLQYGTARCSREPSCLGLDAGEGPWTVWHVRWQRDDRPAWIAVVFEADTGRQLWLGGGGAN